jgi:nitrate reductase delta subunit
VKRTATSRRATALTDAQLTVAWQAASLLLGYPDEELLGHLDLIEEAAGRLPEHVGEPLRACAAHLRATPLTELEEDYVDTFDTRRRHNLFLTYFAHGDTRKRGMALLRFKQTYLASCFELTDTELPDHLCVVLEYAATVDREQGRRLILDHRAGLELLRISLTEAGSRWAGAVEAVTATLPPLQGDERDAVRRLAAEGPPEEEVGLTPYSTPAFDPGPARPDGPTPLPMPSFPGAR